MAIGSRIRSGLRNIFQKRLVDHQLDEEVRSYVDMVTDERISAGMSATEARRTALAEFGGLEQVKQSVRDHRAGTAVELAWQDVRYGVRQLRHNRGFTITAVLTLGLGIGATTTIFSAVYSLLLRPLPYHESHRLMSVYTNSPGGHSDVLISPDFVAAQTETKSFEQFAGYDDGSDNLTGAGDPVRATRASVSSNFFSALGIVPQLGRSFLPNENWTGAPPVIILSNRLWQSRFNSDPKIVGKTAVLNGKQQTIIGVLPAHFSFPDLTLEPDYYAPIALDPDTTVSIARPVWQVHAIARLRSGVSMEQARAEVQALLAARAKDFPREMESFWKGREAVVEPLQGHLTGDDRKPLYILLLCVAAVLLIACANVANLQLARALSRRHETALRGALGASHLRLIRQFLVESLILSMLATVLGIALALVITSLVRYAGALDASRVSSRTAQLFRLPLGKLSVAIQVDGWVLAFTVGIALATTFLFGLAPAISGARADLRNALQTAALRITSGREQRRLRHGLLMIEVGLAVVLLASAGLLIRSFVNVMRYESGFDPGNTLTAVTLMSDQRYASGKQIESFVDQLLPRLQALPGVEAATVASALPLQPVFENTAITFEGVPTPPIATWPLAAMISVTPDYFRVVGTPILKGRPFKAGDRDGVALVAIVNRAFAKRFFAGDALGKRFKTNVLGVNAFQFRPATIVGVAEDVRHGGLEQQVQPEAFFPMAQVPQGAISIALRTQQGPEDLAKAMRQAVTAVDPAQPIFDIQTMEQRVSSSVAQRRLIMSLIACFALIAVTLSAVGVYGVFAYSVTQRAQEMGIRLALGASRGGLLRMIVLHAARLIVIGGVIGVGVGLALSRLLASLLVGITPHDALSFSLAWALMTTVALLASAIPAAHAARTDLVSVLHSE